MCLAIWGLASAVFSLPCVKFENMLAQVGALFEKLKQLGKAELRANMHDRQLLHICMCVENFVLNNTCAAFSQDVCPHALISLS